MFDLLKCFLEHGAHTCIVHDLVFLSSVYDNRPSHHNIHSIDAAWYNWEGLIITNVTLLNWLTPQPFSYQKNVVLVPKQIYSHEVKILLFDYFSFLGR